MCNLGSGGPCPCPSAPLATCPWLPAVPARPEAPGWARSAEQAAEPVAVLLFMCVGANLREEPPTPPDAPPHASPVAPVLS